MRRAPVGLLLALITLFALAACQPAAPVTTASASPDGGSPSAAVTSPAPASPDVTVTPSSEPTTAPASATPAPTASPTPSPTPVPVLACTAAQLSAKIISADAGMGSQFATVKVTNISNTTCFVRGTPRVQLVDGSGAILIDSKDAGASGLPHVLPGDPRIKLAKGASAKTDIASSNYCGGITTSDPVTVALILPKGLGRLVAAPGSGAGVPPCLGDPGSAGSISMNGWRK